MPRNTQFAAAGLVVLLVGSLLATGVVLDQPTVDDGAAPASANWGGDATVETFDSEAQFREYLERTRDGGGGAFGGATETVRRTDEAVAEDDAAADGGDAATGSDGVASASSGAEPGGESGGADRHAGTNVQVEGVDEPDVLKNDGRTLYYAGHRYGRYVDTRVIDADDPSDPEVVSGVPETGRLLLDGDRLVVLQDDEVHGFDVSNRTVPERTWNHDIDGHLEAARLHDGDVYLVVAERADPDRPCPVRPLGEDGPSIECSSVHYSPDASSADATYSVVRLDPESGEVEDATSFVGSSGNTVTYVSENAVYLTYEESPSRAEVQLDFLLGPGSDVLDKRAKADLERLQGYDLSERATRAEIDAILDDWRSRLDENERRAAHRELDEAFESYSQDNLREFTATGVVRVDTGEDLAVDASGKVPGQPLNQFSMDEHEGNLRIATTVNAPQVESENDLYVLDGDLDVIGEVQGMGVDQRVYAVRYVGDEAYVVTFRQIDPFHTIDLSDPENPKELGELELPGFSTYLHPLSEDRVLGIGEENGKVKAVTFDISDRENPTVEDDVILDEHWSVVADTHHAFLIDEKHGVFFLPTASGGYVFDYEDGLEQQMFVETETPAVRATYLDDYLYVFGEEELVVVDEQTWEEERRVDL
jgi:uncharacterized secreted protein with C-terminal beta-propeller domain